VLHKIVSCRFLKMANFVYLLNAFESSSLQENSKQTCVVKLFSISPKISLFLSDLVLIFVYTVYLKKCHANKILVVPLAEAIFRKLLLLV
jgi:hypothetical protein